MKGNWISAPSPTCGGLLVRARSDSQVDCHSRGRGRSAACRVFRDLLMTRRPWRRLSWGCACPSELHKTSLCKANVTKGTAEDIGMERLEFTERFLPACPSWRISSTSSCTTWGFTWKTLLAKSCRWQPTAVTVTSIECSLRIDPLLFFLKIKRPTLSGFVYLFTVIISWAATVEHGCAKSLSAAPLSFHRMSCTVGGAMSREATRSE